MIVAIAATVGNVLVGWDSSTIAGTPILSKIFLIVYFMLLFNHHIFCRHFYIE